MSEKPKPDDQVDMKIDGKTYSGLTGASAESVKRAIANGSFSGFKTAAEHQAEWDRLHPPPPPGEHLRSKPKPKPKPPQ